MPEPPNRNTKADQDDSNVYDTIEISLYYKESNYRRAMIPTHMPASGYNCQITTAAETLCLNLGRPTKGFVNEFVGIACISPQAGVEPQDRA